MLHHAREGVIDSPPVIEFVFVVKSPSFTAEDLGLGALHKLEATSAVQRAAPLFPSAYRRRAAVTFHYGIEIRYTRSRDLITFRRRAIASRTEVHPIEPRIERQNKFDWNLTQSQKKNLHATNDTLDEEKMRET